MEIAERINALMKNKGLSRYKLAKQTGVPYTTLIKILDGTTKNPQIETLSTISEYLGVTVDYLSGQSLGAILEIGVSTLGISLDDLASKAGVRKEFLTNIDSIDPDSGDYEAIERVAKVLGLSPAPLRSALARQEPPVYDGPSVSVEAAFGNLAPEEKASYGLSIKEERDIAVDLERMIGELESSEAMAFHGEPMDDETKELMRISLENSLRLAKGMAKQKFNPNKNK